MDRAIVLFLASVIALLLIPTALASPLSAEERAQLEVETRSFFSEEPSIIIGKDLTMLERALFKSIIAADENLSKLLLVGEEEGRLLVGERVLLGGPSANTLAQELDMPEREADIGPFSLRFYNKTNQTKTLVIATAREEQNLAYHGIEKSPLSKILPPAAVPVAASLISIFLMLFAQLMMKTGMSVGKDIAALRAMGWWKQKFSDKPAKHHVKVKQAHLPVREIVTVFTGIFLIGFASAWIYSGEYLAVLLSIIPASATIGVYRYIARIWYCHHNHMKIEAILWPAGILVTLVSVLLGNLFSLTSYWRVHHDKKGRSAKHGWFLAVMTLLLGLVAWLLNLFFPSNYWQLLSVLGVTIPFIDLFPIPPLFGWSIWKWQKWRWIVTFLIAFCLYILVVFVSAHII
jgi:hypothetical protein